MQSSPRSYNMQEKCKKHRQPLLECKDNHYGDECDCLPKCKVCVRVQEKQHEKMMRRCNYCIEVTNYPSAFGDRLITAFKYKPRKRLKPGDYAIIDPKTGYLIKATTEYVQFYVVK